MDYIVIPDSTTGIQVATSISPVLALDNSQRHIEMVVPASRKALKQTTLLDPYRVITDIVDETLGLLDLNADDPKLINCAEYSELTVSMYAQPSVGCGFVCVGYILKNNGQYAPVAILPPFTNGFRIDNNVGFHTTVSVGGEDWVLNADYYSVRVSLFDRVALLLVNKYANTTTKIALCYSMV